VYDVMGRASQQSNPAETNASWQPVGDDDPNSGGSGWIYTQQTYDWKGRPLVTTNQDGTQKSASYAGCGCAGGEVVTLTDEGTIINSELKRRTQRIYSDVLGRQWKTEVLNWDSTVYATTTNTFNARDQVTLVRQFQGTDQSGVYQDTAMSYDGYGRLQTKHVPEQQVDPNNSASTDHTTWEYNPDDTIQKITDARGAISTYGYNGRHQVTSVSHALSGYSTTNVTYGYDAAGNRTSMSHLVGGVAKDSATYNYDQLSRMTSETRHINALEGYAPNYGNFTMSYGYTISGELQSLTDPFNSTTNLNYDSAGRTSSVTGSYGGTNYTYASSVGYRAWGAVKAASFGDNFSETVSYNSRMQPTQFRIGTNYMRYDYSYFDDGRLKQLTDLDDVGGQPSQVQFHYMSRAYSYDQAARVSGVSGVPNNWNLPPPFSGNYSYDAFNNMTSRSGQYALNPNQLDSATYTNNRRVGWTYDADGRIVASADSSNPSGSSTRTWTYDAAGEEVSVAETISNSTATDTLAYDGDGELIYESVVNPSTTTTTTYYLIHSAVLGTVLTKLDASGNKDTTWVPANGLISPLQQKDYNGNPAITWPHVDVTGLQGSGVAYDPFGTSVNNVQPPIIPPPPVHVFAPQPFCYSCPAETSFINANNLAAGCNVGGFPMDCNRAMIARMGIEFAMNLPGFHLDNLYAEASYVSSFAFQTRRWVNDPIPKVASRPKLQPLHRDVHAAFYDPYSPEKENRPGHWETINWGGDISLDELIDPDPQDTRKRWIGGDRLSDCYKKLLKPFFAINLSDVSIHHYIPPGPRLWSNPDGYTFGNDIYFKNYNPSTEQGLTDLLHELTHVQQFKELGLIGFPKEYLKEYKQNRNKGMSDQDAYFNIRLEAEARQHAEETYKTIIANNGGKNPCAQ